MPQCLVEKFDIRSCLNLHNQCEDWNLCVAALLDTEVSGPWSAPELWDDSLVFVC